MLWRLVWCRWLRLIRLFLRLRRWLLAFSKRSGDLCSVRWRQCCITSVLLSVRCGLLAVSIYSVGRFLTVALWAWRWVWFWGHFCNWSSARLAWLGLDLITISKFIGGIRDLEKFYLYCLRVLLIKEWIMWLAWSRSIWLRAWLTERLGRTSRLWPSIWCRSILLAWRFQMPLFLNWLSIWVKVEMTYFKKTCVPCWELFFGWLFRCRWWFSLPGDTSCILFAMVAINWSREFWAVWSWRFYSEPFTTWPREHFTPAKIRKLRCIFQFSRLL